MHEGEAQDTPTPSAELERVAQVERTDKAVAWVHEQGKEARAAVECLSDALAAAQRRLHVLETAMAAAEEGTQPSMSPRQTLDV